MKKIKFHSKRATIKSKKKKLISKIEACKKLSELKGWEKTFSYHSILAKDFDWDYEFLLDLIKFKLQRMSIYFHTHNIIENEERWARVCDTAIGLLDIGYLNETILTEDLKGIYVNTKNKNRFISKSQISKEYWDKYGLAIVRTAKAKKIFWKFMHHYIEYLWD